MFERLAGEARSVVISAQDEARGLRDQFIGTEHLVLAMLSHDGVGGRLLTARGMSAEAIRRQLRRWDGEDSRLDPGALATLGIDLDSVRRVTEEQFGPGALDARPRRIPLGHSHFTKRAKKALELALREARSLDSKSVNSGHLLLGVIADEGGVGNDLIRGAGLDMEELRAEARIRAAQLAA